MPDVGGLWLAGWMEQPGQPVHWDGAVNAWRISGSVFRMGRREWVTEAGWKQAYDDGVRTVIDLRNAAEHGRRDTDPEVGADVLAAFDVVHAPTEDPDHPEFKELCSPYLNDPDCYAANARLFPDKLVAVFRAVAAAPAGVVIHCSAGRDRSGMIAAMLQDLTGAGDHEIVSGYQAAMRGINERHRTAAVAPQARALPGRTRPAAPAGEARRRSPGVRPAAGHHETIFCGTGSPWPSWLRSGPGWQPGWRRERNMGDALTHHSGRNRFNRALGLAAAAALALGSTFLAGPAVAESGPPVPGPSAPAVSTAAPAACSAAPVSPAVPRQRPTRAIPRPRSAMPA